MNHFRKHTTILKQMDPNFKFAYIVQNASPTKPDVFILITNKHFVFLSQHSIITAQFRPRSYNEMHSIQMCMKISSIHAEYVRVCVFVEGHLN